MHKIIIVFIFSLTYLFSANNNVKININGIGIEYERAINPIVSASIAYNRKANYFSTESYFELKGYGYLMGFDQSSFYLAGFFRYTFMDFQGDDYIEKSSSYTKIGLVIGYKYNFNGINISIDWGRGLIFGNEISTIERNIFNIDEQDSKLSELKNTYSIKIGYPF